MRISIFNICLITSFIIVSCKSETKQEKECALGKPTAIFNNKMEGIKNHSFNAKGQDSKESLILPDDVTLEIDQTGCDYVNQQFTFILTNELKLDSFSNVVDTVIARFNKLSGMNQNLKAFSLWSNALKEIRPYIHQGEEFPVGDGVSISVDKMNSFNKTSLFVKCFQKPPTAN